MCSANLEIYLHQSTHKVICIPKFSPIFLSFALSFRMHAYVYLLQLLYALVIIRLYSICTKPNKIHTHMYIYI